jgi:hypothetical protein
MAWFENNVVVVFWTYLAIGLTVAFFYVKGCGQSKTEALILVLWSGLVAWPVYDLLRDHASSYQAISASALAAWLFIVSVLVSRHRNEFRRMEVFDVPLVEVIALTVTFKRGFFSECLKLPEDEIDNCEQLISGFRLRLQIWKGHYGGDVAYWRKNETTASETSSIWKFPSWSQFPVNLGRAGLFSKDTGDSVLGPERLTVSFDPSSFTIRGEGGRFLRSDSFDDLVIPARASDLSEFAERSGEEDADWLMAKGHTRHYERDGRWAHWTIAAVNPESLAWNTRDLRTRSITLND